MVDSSSGRTGSGAGRCQWCSAPLPAGASGTCPACGAALGAREDLQIPGVTAIDPEALLRRGRPPRPRSRLLAFLLGEGSPPPPPGEAVAPPPPQVRREILRLTTEATALPATAETAEERGSAGADEGGEPDRPPPP